MKIINITEEQLQRAYEVAIQSFPCRLEMPLEPMTFNPQTHESKISLMAASSPFAENKNIHHWVVIEVMFYSEKKGHYMRSHLFSVDNYSDETYSSYESFRAKFDRVFNVDGVKKKVNEKWEKYTGSKERIQFQLLQEEGEEVAT